MNVQQVIYVVVDRFTLSVDGASPRPGATVRVKVLDLEDQTRIFPGDDNGHLVEAELREPPQSMYVSTSGRRQIEDQLAMQLATDIAESSLTIDGVRVGRVVGSGDLRHDGVCLS